MLFVDVSSLSLSLSHSLPLSYAHTRVMSGSECVGVARACSLPGSPLCVSLSHPCSHALTLSRSRAISRSWNIEHRGWSSTAKWSRFATVPLATYTVLLAALTAKFATTVLTGRCVCVCVCRERERERERSTSVCAVCMCGQACVRVCYPPPTRSVSVLRALYLLHDWLICVDPTTSR